ncbi:MAG: alpha/beta hydrolase, partial [Acidimicrobiales bacterium]
QVPARWFREYMAHDPAADLRAIGCPVLAVTGRKDLQVDVDDLQVIADLVSAPCQVEAPADLTHLLRSTLDRPAITQYRALLEQPVDAGLTDLVASWTRDASGPSVKPSSPAR